MSNEHTKLKRALGFSASYGAAVGLVVSGTAMFSVSSVAASAGHATFISAAIGMIPMMVAAFAFGELTAMIPGGAARRHRHGGWSPGVGRRCVHGRRCRGQTGLQRDQPPVGGADALPPRALRLA